METENMIAVESRGTCNVIKEQYEKTLSFRKRTCAKKENVVKRVIFLSLSL